MAFSSISRGEAAQVADSPAIATATARTIDGVIRENKVRRMVRSSKGSSVTDEKHGLLATRGKLRWGGYRFVTAECRNCPFLGCVAGEGRGSGEALAFFVLGCYHLSQRCLSIRHRHG